MSRTKDRLKRTEDRLKKLGFLFALNDMVPILVRIEELAKDYPPSVTVAVQNLQEAYDRLNLSLLSDAASGEVKK